MNTGLGQEGTGKTAAAAEGIDLFKPMTGSWKVDMTLTLKPGYEPQHAQVISRIQLLGGIFLEEWLEGKSGNMPVGGLSITRWNALERTYEVSRFSVRIPTLQMTEKGKYDEKSGAFVCEGSYSLEGALVKQRSVIRMTGPNSILTEVFISMNDSSEYKSIEMKYTPL
jgi:hypothetical protein